MQDKSKPFKLRYKGWIQKAEDLKLGTKDWILKTEDLGLRTNDWGMRTEVWKMPLFEETSVTITKPSCSVCYMYILGPENASFWGDDIFLASPYSSFLIPLLFIPHSSVLSPESSVLSPQSSFLSPQSSFLSPLSSVICPQSLVVSP